MKKLALIYLTLAIFALSGCDYIPRDVGVLPDDVRRPMVPGNTEEAEGVFSDVDAALYPRNAYVEAASAGIYAEAAAGSESLTELVCGMEATILSASGEWYRVSIPGMIGYMKAGALRMAGDKPQAQRGEVGALVNLRAYAPGIRTRMALLKEGSWGAPVYTLNVCALARHTADRLIAAQKELARKGRGIKILDAYRDEAAQAKLMSRALSPVEINRGSAHRAGVAVDVTLVGADGRELAMPTPPYDSDANHASDSGYNALVLRDAMQKHGFTPSPDAWWHFEDAGAANQPLSGVSLAEFLP